MMENFQAMDRENRTTYLLKLGELTLKGGNRDQFEGILKKNIALMLKGTHGILNTTNGRYFVHCAEDQEGVVEDVLGRVFGLSGWAKVRTCEKTVEALLAASVAEAKSLLERGVHSFKVEARRVDKAFPLTSYQIMAQAGEAITETLGELRVDVHHPEAIIRIEIRERAYIYGAEHPGLQGLPVGSAGKGLLLLSGGIDSPVAGYLMARRGMRIEGIHFHTYPYTSREAQQKVQDLAALLTRYTITLKLTSVSFTQVQTRIRDRAPGPWSTILLRMAMMECAERIGRRKKIRCLITGESLSQVASQTVENIASTESLTTLPILRPLIGIDKDEIIRIARKIGTYETSILPYQDCCVLFSHPHPITRSKVSEAKNLYKALELEDLIEQAILGACRTG
jgi:thiamine biosynthesis protein ThiI